MCKRCNPAKAGSNKAIKHIQENIQYNVLNEVSIRPYTYVLVEAVLDSVTYHIKSFSKCNPVDRWNKKRGVEIAVGRGLKKLARGVYDGKLPDGISRFKEDKTLVATCCN